MNIVLPKYTTILPISNRAVEFRPFTVKEEKLLIMANAGSEIKDVTSAVGRLVKDCTDGAVDIDRDAMFDVFHLFLQLRGKSISEVMDIFLVCDACEHKTPAQIHINDFKLLHTAGHTDTIDLGVCRVVMKYPTYKYYSLLYETVDPDRVYDVVAGCIEKIVTPDEVQVQTANNFVEFREFVDNLIPEQFQKLSVFFETMPLLQHRISYVCNGTVIEDDGTTHICGKQVEVAVDGISNFFG